MNWLSQKPDSEPTPPHRSTTPAPSAPQVAPPPAPVAREAAPAPSAAAPRGASIGKSIHIKGELSGNEDLAVEGKVEGKITLSGCRVTIGTTGQVTAEIVAKSVVVGGQVKGSIRAEERVEVAATGNVTGDIRAPRVILMDGAKFKGSVDMDPAAGASAASSAPAKRAADPLLTPDESPMYASAKQS